EGIPPAFVTTYLIASEVLVRPAGRIASYDGGLRPGTVLRHRGAPARSRLHLASADRPRPGPKDYPRLSSLPPWRRGRSARGRGRRQVAVARGERPRHRDRSSLRSRGVDACGIDREPLRANVPRVSRSPPARSTRGGRPPERGDDRSGFGAPRTHRGACAPSPPLPGAP